MSRAPRRGLTLEIGASHAPDFRGDPEDLAEIVFALAENAVKWASARVRVAGRRCPEGLMIEITDDGPGIPEGARARLLTRGARLDEAVPGHGLGLAIASDRIAAYGGRLELGEADGGGLAVVVILPARA